jgi:hypothetical protein
MSMRLMIFALGVLLLAGLASAAIPADCDSNMVAYWQMEGDAKDALGVYHGSDYPSPATFIVDDGASFDGSQMMSINDPQNELALSGGSGFSIEFWVQKKTSPLPQPGTLLNKVNYEIKWTALDEISATVGGVTVTGLSGLSTGTGNGHHVVLTWRSAAKNLSLYVDAVLRDSATLTYPGTSSSNLQIGQDFVGLIDEVALYDRSFNQHDVDFHKQTSGGGRDYCYTAGDGSLSSTRTDFTLKGCQLPDGSSISAGSCSRNGMFYCGEDTLELYDTLAIYRSILSDKGCSQEEDTYDNGDPFCCPGGFVCKDDADGDGLVCHQSTVECSDFTSEGSCNGKIECFWMGDDIGCTNNPRDYSCSIYDNEKACNSDVWNLGAAGAGTDICGTYFVSVDNSVPPLPQTYIIPTESCRCDWVDNGDVPGVFGCELGWDIAPDIYGGVENRFRCSKDFFTGDCIDGSQLITWDSVPKIVTGWGGSVSNIPAEVLEKGGCDTDSVGKPRSCGDPIIKVPGFSLFALFASMGIIGLVYFFRKE